MRADRRDVTRVPLQSFEGNFLHKITYAEGAGMVATGIAIAIRDFRYGRNAIVGYRLTAAAKPSNSERDSPVITRREMLAALGAFGPSRTANLPEWDTKLRDSKYARELANDPKMPPEDFIEEAVNKDRMWDQVYLQNPKHLAWA